MKAKFLLGALVFPMIFGACTNDLFEQEPVSLPENSVLAGREKVNVSLNVERVGAEAPQTRVDGYWDGSGIQWAWRDKNDGMGAVVVDYLPGDKIVDKNTSGYEDYVITNYPFYPQIEQSSKSANFRTPTAVVTGAYLFYSQYDGDMISRGQIVDEIPRLQNVKPGFDNGVLQIGSERTNGIGQNFFVSPIVNVGVKHDADFELPLALTSAHSILHIRLDANLESKYYGENGLSINKIVLRALDDTNTPFNRKLTLNPIDIANLQKGVKAENPTLPIDDRGVINGLAEPSEVTRALNAVLNKIMSIEDGEVDTDAPVSDIGDYSDATEDKSSDLVYQLDEPFVFEKESDVMDLLVIMPAGTYNGKSGLKEYEGKTNGALRLTVYTSEGTYDTYIGGGAGTQITAHRAEKINVKRTLEIMGGKTNINLFDPNKGFDIESTQDWNFTIEYIKNHLRDFGNGSNWKKPVLNLVEGQIIEVDPEHYFLDYPVEYNGNATLKLKDQSEYVINPNNVILDETNRPTILIEGQPESTVKFEDPAKDVTEYTDAYKLVSDAKVIVEDAQSLKFEKLVSNTAMQVGANAKVNITSDEAVVLNGNNIFAAGSSVTATTTGKVTLNNATLNNDVAVTLAGANNVTTGTLDVKADAELTVNGAYTNDAKATIEGNAKMTLKGASTNNNSIEVGVDGYLNASDVEFTNGTGATLTLVGEEQGMNSDSRSKADINALINNGTIDIVAGGDKKGTYGGRLNVSTSIVNNAGADINVNGELFATAATGTNYGKITLMDDEYAVIQLAGSKFSSVNEGYILLSAPANYEMFNSYYTVHNKLTGVKGAIVANLNQTTFNKVLENYNSTTLGSQERAWQVINKVNVIGEVEFTTVYLATGKKVAVKDFILNNSKFIAKDADMTIGSLTINGKSAFETKVPTIITVNKVVSVEESSDFSVAEDVTMNIKPSSSTMLTVNGLMTNNGQINTIESTNYGKPNYIRTIINENGKLVNHGTLSQKSTSVYSTASAEYKTLKAFVNDYNKGTNNIRVEVLKGNTTNVSGKWSNSKESVDKTTLAKILSEGKAMMIKDASGNSYQGLVITKDASNVYALYLGGGINESKDTAEFNNARTYDLTKGEVTLADYVTGAKSNPTDAKTWFYVSYNYGTLELAEDGQAWGEIVNNKGFKKGDFENE